MRTRYFPTGGGVVLAAILLIWASQLSAQSFTPARTFPDTWDKIHVFVDQLGNLSVAQQQFAASHYDGTQKQTTNLIDAIRVYNSNFIMLQYRLAVRESEPSFIHNNTWSNDFQYVWDNHDDWFVHATDGSRVYQVVGSYNEYVMDISGTINHPAGNTNGWKEYVAGQMIADANASHADGIFGDSTHLPYAVPSFFYSSTNTSAIGAPPHTAYIDDMEAFYNYIYPALHAGNIYWIPNIGALCTTSDTTTGYYTDVDGAMVEGYAVKSADWKMQQNRTLNLIRNGKIFIAQNGPSDYTKIPDRLWYVTNFLLLKDHHSYLNMLGAGSSQMHWWPEYDVDLGHPYSDTVPSNIDDLKNASGVYLRRYQRGQVLVNPNSSAKTITVDPSWGNLLVTPYGGGQVTSTGTIERASGLIYRKVTSDQVTVGAWTGAILEWATPGDGNLDRTVDVGDLTILSNNWRLGGKTWCDGDFTGDGTVDVLDLTVLATNWRISQANPAGAADAPIPEPATLTLLGLGAVLVVARRRK